SVSTKCLLAGFCPVSDIASVSILYQPPRQDQPRTITMSQPKIAIVIGSTRENRFGDKPAQWVYELGKERTDLDFEIVDLRGYPLPFFEEAASPLWAPSKGEVAQKWQKKMAEFDGFIFTAAEYNRGPT